MSDDKHPEARAAYARAKEGVATPDDARLLADAIDAMHPEVEQYRLVRKELGEPLSVPPWQAIRYRFDALEKAVRDAPHGPDCIRLEDHRGRPCDCWKSKVANTASAGTTGEGESK